MIFNFHSPLKRRWLRRGVTVEWSPTMDPDNPSDRDRTPPADRPQPYTRRVLLAVGVAVGAILLALFLYWALYVLLLAFAGILLAVLLRGSAEWGSKKTGLSVNWSLAVVILGVTGAFVLLGW